MNYQLTKCYTCGNNYACNKGVYPYLCNECTKKLRNNANGSVIHINQQNQAKRSRILQSIQIEINKAIELLQQNTDASFNNSGLQKDVISPLKSSGNTENLFSESYSANSSTNELKIQKKGQDPKNQNNFSQSMNTSQNSKQTRKGKIPVPKTRQVTNETTTNQTTKVQTTPTMKNELTKLATNLTEIDALQPVSFFGKVRPLTKEERRQKPFVCSYCQAEIDSNSITPIVFIQCAHENYHDYCFAQAMSEGKHKCSTCHQNFFRKV